VGDYETVTTKAGSFDTVRIESSFKLSAAATPLKEGESTYVLWFSAKLDHQQNGESMTDDINEVTEGNIVRQLEQNREMLS
jgi:hypothetical protein